MNLNATAYYYDYEDLQVFSSEVNNGVTTAHYSNAAKASVLGLELEIQAIVTDNLVVEASYSYTNSEYDKYEAKDSVACAILDECDVQDLSGNQLNLSPETKFSLSAMQYFEIDNTGEISLMAGYSYIGEQYGRRNVFKTTFIRIVSISHQGSKG
jgi:iron complex outermembrane receptor protein